MKKNTLKYVIDAALFVDVCSIAAIGLLMAFVIPEGGGPGVSKYFLGLHRHQWGAIHLNLSLLLIGLVALHLWLNWSWIRQSTTRFFGRKWKQALWTLAAAWIGVVLIGWLVSL